MTEFEEKVFEVERSRVVNGKEVYSKDFLDALEDGPAWFESRSGRGLVALDDISLPIGWKWGSNWKISLTEAGADQEGWVKSGRLRRRKWLRKREKMMSSTSQATVSTGSRASSSSTSGLGPGISTPRDETSVIRSATESLQRLDATVQKLAVASERTTVDRLVREGRDAIAEGQDALGILASSEKPTIRAARIKLSNDLVKDGKRFETIVSEAYARASWRSDNSVPSNKNAASIASIAALQQEEEQASREHQRSLEKQREENRLMEQRHRQLMSHEIDTNTAMIEERHKELTEINRTASTVNAMMKDLAKLVDEQDGDIKKIVKNTESAKDTVSHGLAEVQKADKYQQEGGCSIC
jgi:hypothetical protein